MTDDDREWLRIGVERAGAVRASGGLTREHMGYYYLVGWLERETESQGNVVVYHDGGGIF